MAERSASMQDPAEATRADDAVRLDEASQRVEAARPDEAQRVQPAEPAERTQPVEPVQDVEPAEPARDVEPEQLGQPSERVDLAQPEEPSEPNESDESDEQGEATRLAHAAHPVELSPMSRPAGPSHPSAPLDIPWPESGQARVHYVTAPPGVPTAADLAAAHVAVEWDEREPRDLLGATEQLRAEVAAIALPLELPAAARARRDHEALLGQLDDYLLPRLRRLDAPLLAVVGGSTGAGKSTLVNSIARREVTRSGVLRPTTRSPVLVHHPYDSGAFLSQRVLPGLARVTSEAPEPAQPIDIDAPRVTALRLVPHDGITPGLAIIDAPDIDSVVEANRELAVQLLASADLWVFVTTSARYGDAVPWHMLKQAVDRGAAVSVVLDRVPEEVMQEVRTHLATLLRDNGLGTSPMFTIPEAPLDDGFLPHEIVAPLAGWLRRLALDVRSRDVVVRRTLIGILDSLRERIQIVAAAADAQADAEATLRADVGACYDEALGQLSRSLGDGSVVRGEALARWQEFVATGDVFRSLEPGAGRLRDRVRARVRGRVAPAQPLLDALFGGLQDVVHARAEEASESLQQAWRTHPGGASLITAVPGLADLSDGFDERLARALREWRMALTDIVRERPVEGRSGGGALGLDGAAAVLAVLAVSRPDDGSPGTAAGVAAVVLRALFGADAVQPLAQAALADLTQRTSELLENERARVLAVLDALRIRPTGGEVLLARAAVVEEAR